MNLNTKKFVILCVFTVALFLIAKPANAAIIDISTLFSNFGFENGNLSGWTLTRPNATYVATLSPAVNPVINPADVANNPTILTAPVGSYFTGLMRPGDAGDDLKYKLAHNAIPLSVAAGDIFQVTVWANRGRLEPYDTPGSTGTVPVKIFGWTTNGSTPTVTASNDNWSRAINWNPAAQNFDFTGVPDGTWASQTFTFDPAVLGINAANLQYLALSVSGQNQNHDQYVAIDLDNSPVIPEPTSALLFGFGLAFSQWHRRFKKS